MEGKAQARGGMVLECDPMEGVSMEAPEGPETAGGRLAGTYAETREEGTMRDMGEYAKLRAQRKLTLIRRQKKEGAAASVREGRRGLSATVETKFY